MGKVIQRQWHLIDASSKTLGRVATEASKLLIGKHKPNFSFETDDGDFVVIINAKDVKVTGSKMLNKVYYDHSGFSGGLKETPLKDLLATKPQEVFSRAIKGMIPKNKLGSKMMTRLRVYPDANHNHHQISNSTPNKEQ